MEQVDALPWSTHNPRTESDYPVSWRAPYRFFRLAACLLLQPTQTEVMPPQISDCLRELPALAVDFCV